MPDDQYLSLLISSQGDKVAGAIVEFMRRAGLTTGCYAYKFRVKSKEDLLDKKQRKIEKKPLYTITDITDVIGVRLVTLFKGDMFKAYANLIEMLANPVGDSQFNQAMPEEIIVYKGTSALDDFANEIKTITKSHFKSAQVKTENSVEGYSSIHIICRHSAKIEELSNAENSYRLPIEIQIRTVFEDAWGEIDHKYGYVVREGKDAGTPIHNSHHIKAHLKVLKDFSDACMEYAECIRKEALPEVLDLTAGVTKTISVESDEDVLQRFREIGIKEEFIQRYVEARSLRDKAAEESGATHDGRITAEQTYLQAAELFAALMQELAPGDTAASLRDGSKLAYYYCAMNEGLCLMSTNISDNVNAAVDKYIFIETHYKNYPLAKMRLGQALGKVGRIDESIDRLRNAGSALQKLGERSLASGLWTDYLPKADYEHMLYTQPKILGYTLWKKSQQSGTIPRREKSELYFEAYITTMSCLDAKNIEKKKIIDVYNNLLYYCVGFAFCTDSGDQRLATIKAEIPTLLATMLKESGGAEQMSIEDLDTVFRAYALLGDVRAKEIATTLIQRCLRRDAGIVTSLRMSIAEVAQEYLDKGTIVAM